MLNLLLRAHQKALRRFVSDYSELASNLKKFKRRNMRKKRSERPQQFADYIEILVPCYNHADYLWDAYQSIVTQSYKKSVITVTFINDNSSDNTAKVIEKICEDAVKHSLLKVKTITNSQNLRQYGSINKAVHESSNQLFIILNDDDALTPNSLKIIIETLTKHTDLSMLGGSSIWFEKQLPKFEPSANKKQLTVYLPEDIGMVKKLNDINMTHSSSSFFKSAWQAVGGYTAKKDRLIPEANEDRDFQLRVAALFAVGVYKTYPLAYWRTDSSHGKDF